MPDTVNFSEMASVLATVTPMRMEHWTAFVARLKHFHRLGLGPRSGMGKAQYFTADEAILFGLGFQMACVGVGPDKIVSDITAFADDILKAVSEDDAKGLVIIYCQPPLYTMMTSEGARRFQIVSKSDAPPVGDLNRAIIINLGALVAEFRAAWSLVISRRGLGSKLSSII